MGEEKGWKRGAEKTAEKSIRMFPIQGSVWGYSA